MHKIKTLELENFKFFHGKQPISFDRKNMLIFGENGSGKSSIYWSLYTFLQSVTKTDDTEIKKYFDPTHDQCLTNRFAGKNDVSAIRVTFEDENKAETKREISLATINTKSGTIVKEALQSSDFINYKLLSKIYDAANGEEIDLFPFFEREILSFITFSQDYTKSDGSVGTANAGDLWKMLKPGLHPRGKMHEEPYKRFHGALWVFNTEFDTYLKKIIERANDFLQTKFEQPFKIQLTYINSTYDDFIKGSKARNKITKAPKIILEIEYLHDKLAIDKKEIKRPHTFLNEARLTTVALSIRFAVLYEKLSLNAPKILVLDDLLLSLDMSNRDKVLDIILSEFNDFQLIILTHDKFFFEMTKHKAALSSRKDWQYLEMYANIENDIPQPLVTEAKSYLEKAEKFLALKEYEAAGNFLRKEAEHFCKLFLPKSEKYIATETEYKLADLNEMIKRAKKYADKNGLDTALFDALDNHRKFIFNPLSHDSYDVPKFRSELEKCVKTMQELKKYQVKSFLPEETTVSFDLTTIATTIKSSNIYKFEITNFEPLRLIIKPDGSQVLSTGLLNYYVYTGEEKGDLQHKKDGLKQMYDYNYGKSDKAKPADFWDGIIVNSNGRTLREWLNEILI
jgi:ABC-type cobalamin/Fe3+-siderophores transport system ATPase subunit